MPNNVSRKPKLPATTLHLDSDASPSAANTPPHPLPYSTPRMKFTHHSGLELENWGYSSNQNCHNVFPNNSVDNRMDQSVNISRTGTKIINFNYPPRSNERTNEPLAKAHFMVPYSRNEGFIGISQTLEWLKEKIKGGRATHHRVALWGMGGIGKTQDVLECIYHYQSSQQLSVFWVHAGSQLRFTQDYWKLAGLAGLLISEDVKEDIRPVVKSWLEGPESGDWILVLDNADNKLDFFKSALADSGATGDNGLADFIPHGSKGTVIITTRDREVADWLVGPCNILDKTLMDSTHARQLFTQNYPKAIAYTGNIKEEISISQLLEALQYLPLAIAQVAAYLRQNTLVLPSEYLNLFRSTKDCQNELLSKPFSDLRRESQFETVLATFSISFRQLQEQSPLASSLLQLIACIDNQCIPHELLACSVEDDDHIAQLRLVEALSKLIAFGLLSTSRQEKGYEMHSLVHVSINSFISAREKDTAVKQIAKTFRRIYPEMQSKSYGTWILYLSHTSALISSMTESCEDKAFIYSTMSLLFLLIANISAAKEKAKQGAKSGTDILGPDHPDTLRAIGNLATTYMIQGRLKTAEKLEIQVVEARKRLLGPEHPDTLRAISSLASTYGGQGRLKTAESLEVQVMETRRSVLGPKHPDTLRAISNLAATYWHQGRLEAAEKLDVDTYVMEAWKRAFGPEHPDTLIAIGNLASTYRNQGRLEEAEKLEIQVMEARKKVLGPEHPHTLLAIRSLAVTYKGQGRLEEAEELENQIEVIQARKRAGSRLSVVRSSSC